MAMEKAAAPVRRAAQKPKRKWLQIGGFDMPFLILVLLVLSVGLVCMFSASFVYAYYNDGDSYYYIRRQMMFALIGVVAMLVCSCVDYHVWHKLAVPVFAVSVVLLAVVLMIPSSSGVQRWIRLPGFQIQPSEVAKFGLILLFAHMVARQQGRVKGFKDGFLKGFLPYILLLGLVCGLVVLEPHLSGTILIFAIGFTMMFIGGSPWYWLVGLLAIGGVAVLVMVFGLHYEYDRILVWLHPFESYAGDMRNEAWQTVQSLYAIGSGGLLGQGLGNSRQKHLFLPEPQNDFIFAVVSEELGFIGGLLIILLFAVLVWRGFSIGLKARDKFGAMLAFGLTAQIGLQVAMNLSVVSNLIPNTGISLPFFSYGGSSLVMLLGQMGVVLSVSRRPYSRLPDGSDRG